MAPAPRNLDAVGHQRLVRLAAFMHVRTQDGTPWFTRQDLADVAELAELGGTDETSAKARARDLERLATFGITAQWNDEEHRYDIAHLDLTEREQRALAKAATIASCQDWEKVKDWNVPAAFVVADSAIRLHSEPVLEQLIDAANERRRVRVCHRDTWRECQPLGVAFRSGRWYLAAWDPADGLAKVFSLSRITDVAASDETWEPVGPVDIEAHVDGLLDPQRWGRTTPIEVTLAVDPAVLMVALRSLPKATHTGTEEDGRAVVTCGVSNLDHFLYRLLGLRTRAEVLGPPQVRRLVVDRLRSMADA
jgi:predicted DNA-binding transcriptional regulator YafY